MKAHTTEYKNQIKQFGRQIDSKITYTLNGEEIELGAEELNSITPSFKSSLLKSVMKELEIDCNEEIPKGTIVNYQFGLKVGNNYEYLDFGNYIVDKVEKQEDKNSWIINCYDKMLYAMKDYEQFNTTYPITIRDYIIALCTKIGLTFANSEDEFCNYDKEIQNELFISQDGRSLGYTYRDVLDQLAEVTGSFICINDDDELELRYITQEPVPPTPTPGKNMLDISQGFQLGYISTSGNFISQSQTALFNQIIEVEPGETYCFSTNANVDNLVISMFKANNVYKTRTKVSNSNKVVQLIPSDVVSIRVSVNLDGRTTMTQTIIDNLELMVEHNNTRTEPYEPYESSTNSSETTNDTEEIDEHYLKNINVKFGEKFGPVNSIVLSRSAESDNIYLSDEESIEENGLTEIKIKDNQFMNFNDRDQYLPDLLETLDGLEFYINDFESTGITYLELADAYNIVIGENTYNCIMMNSTIEVSRGLSEDIFTDLPDKTETDYKKSDKTDNRINQAYIIVDKQNQEIEALASRVSDLDGYTKEEIDQLILDTQGLTNKLITTGGNNIFRNTGLWFEDNSSIDYLYPSDTLYCNDDLFLLAEPYYEFWQGKVKKMQEDNASNKSALLLQNATLSQTQEVRNGTYTISFKYKKINSQASLKTVINNLEYILEDEEGEFVQTIKTTGSITVAFICDTDDGAKIYDLMVNVGEEKAEYSQNQNETTTDTVNISKGITITSSDTNTTFKADTDGIRVFDSNNLDGNPITKFTETGTETKKIIVENEAQIVGLLFRNVGNNTWINKL